MNEMQSCYFVLPKKIKWGGEPNVYCDDGGNQGYKERGVFQMGFLTSLSNMQVEKAKTSFFLFKKNNWLVRK